MLIGVPGAVPRWLIYQVATFADNERPLAKRLLLVSAHVVPDEDVVGCGEEAEWRTRPTSRP